MTDKEIQQLVNRFSELIRREREPQALDEDLFIKFYNAAALEVPLIEEITSGQVPSNLTEPEYVGIILGYALGQAYGEYTITKIDH